MVNFKKEDLVLDRKIYVYEQFSKRIRGAVIKGVSGANFNDTFNHDGNIFKKSGAATITFTFCDIDRNSSIGGIYDTEAVKARHSFYVDFSEEFNKRGEKYVGFLTKEDAEYFKKSLIEEEIKEVEEKLEKLKSQII
jgi:hypothetical protein